MKMSDMLTKIVAQNTYVSFHFATITAHNSGAKTCSLTLSGSTIVLTGIRYMKHYNPTVGDIVLVLVNDKDLIIFGHLA
jgi:hypothetical protein